MNAAFPYHLLVCGTRSGFSAGGDCIGAMAAPTEDELEDFIKELELPASYWKDV